MKKQKKQAEQKSQTPTYDLVVEKLGYDPTPIMKKDLSWQSLTGSGARALV